MRKFEGGATRDQNAGKLAYNRFLSPYVLTVYCDYLERHRETANGRREPDNWKAGIPVDVYMESMLRHVWEAWTDHERGNHISMDAMCAVLFNAMGMMHELLERGNHE